MFSFNHESQFYDLVINLILYLSLLMRLIIIKSWIYSLISAEVFFYFCSLNIVHSQISLCPLLIEFT